jgi:hypothetical protein
LSRYSPTRVPGPRRSSAGSPGRTSASARSATATPSATAFASRRCSPLSPRTSANGSSLPAGRKESSPLSPPTTAASGRTTTGATGDRGSGEARSGRRTGEMSRRTRAPRPREPALATYARASSPSRSTPESRSRRSPSSAVRA